MFRLLVPHSQECMRQVDRQGDTALMRIVTSHSDSRDRYESARTVLLSQADDDWDSHFKDEQHNPLQAAVRQGDTDMCHLLIHDGKMNPHSALTRGNDGQLVLKDKPWMNEEAILQLLRTHAAVASTSLPH